MQTKVSVPKDSYLEILAFTTYAYLTNKITAYSGLIGGVRTLGQYIENFIYGKIAEVAFQRFLRDRLGLEVLTDLDLADFIVGPYISNLVALRKGDEYEALRLWIEVKEVRRDQRWLLVPASAVRSRPYDVYVSVWVGLPGAHIAWLTKHVPEVMNKMSSEWRDQMKVIEESIENIPCEVVGFVTWNDVALVIRAGEGDHRAREELDRRFGHRSWYYFSGRESLFDPDDPSWKGSKVRENIGFSLKRLREASDWSRLRELILKNERLVGKVETRRAGGFPKSCGRVRPHEDYRDFAFRCIEIQLENIKRRYGTILRKESWFAQPLTPSL